MATVALSYTENIEGYFAGRLYQPTEMDPTENRLNVLTRRFVRKVGSWPNEQTIDRIKDQVPENALFRIASRWIYEASPSPVYEELLFWVDSWVENVISQIRLSRHIKYAERISIRLNDLRCMALEEDGEIEDISIESVRSFFSFLKMHANLRYPDLTLTPDGNIYSRWKGTNGALLGIEFLKDFKVAYVVFIPTPNHAGELSRHSGIDFTDIVFRRINKAFSVSEWIFE